MIALVATTLFSSPSFAAEARLDSEYLAALYGVENSQAPTAAEGPQWTGAVSLGASVSSGNTDKTTLSATAGAERRAEKDRWSANLVWNYADESNAVTQRSTYGAVKYDYFLSQKAYVFGVVSGANDFKAQLDLRATAGVGVGYQFREDEEWKLSGEAGLSYVDENFELSTDDKDFLAARISGKADYTHEKKWSAGIWGEVFPSLEDDQDITTRADTHARLNLTDKMFAQLQWIYTWDNTPATGADRVDNLYLLTLGWSF